MKRQINTNGNQQVKIVVTRINTRDSTARTRRWSSCPLVLRTPQFLSRVLGVLLIGIIPASLAASPESITVFNNLPHSNVCPNGNTVSVFAAPSQPQKVIGTGEHDSFSGDFTTLPGIGIQINNWYWVAEKSPVSPGGGDVAQNPDNSGAQFAISSECTITENVPPWFGKGIPTYLIANISAATNIEGACVVTINSNNYTDAVTPGCCSPPGIGTDTCQSSQWGQTANGATWPPPSQ